MRIRIIITIFSIIFSLFISLPLSLALESTDKPVAISKDTQSQNQKSFEVQREVGDINIVLNPVLRKLPLEKVMIKVWITHLRFLN